MRRLLFIQAVLFCTLAQGQELRFLNDAKAECMKANPICECRGEILDYLTINLRSMIVEVHQGVESYCLKISEKVHYQDSIILVTSRIKLSLSPDSTKLILLDGSTSKKMYKRIRNSPYYRVKFKWSREFFESLKESKFSGVYEYFNDGTGNWVYDCTCLWSDCKSIIYHLENQEENYEICIEDQNIVVYKMRWVYGYTRDELVRLGDPVLIYRL